MYQCETLETARAESTQDAFNQFPLWLIVAARRALVMALTIMQSKGV